MIEPRHFSSGRGARDTILTRNPESLRLSSSPDSALTPLQAQVDGLVSGFVHEAASPTTLAALTAGGLAYRFGRIGVMGLGVGTAGRSSLWLRPLSVALGLGAEVTAFEFTSRVLRTVPLTPALSLEGEGGGRDSSNLWRWAGPGGWRDGLATSLITFGMLKGAGFLAREQNIVLQHAFQSTAMVAGHQSAGLLGITPRPHGSLAEQLLHAEATNIQLGAGTGLLHLAAPGLHTFERGLDLSLRFSHSSGIAGRPFAWGPQLVTADAARDSRSFPESGRQDPRRNPHILLSENQGGEGGGVPKPGTPGKTPARETMEIRDSDIEVVEELPEKRDTTIDADPMAALLEVPPEGAEPVPPGPRELPVALAQTRPAGELYDRVIQAREAAEAAPARAAQEAAASPSLIPSDFRSELAPGMMLGQFRIIEKRGEGGMAEVWHAWDTELNRDVAIKIPHQGLDSKAYLQRFEAEKQITAQLDPRYVASVHGTVALPGGVRVPVMEYIRGQDLSEIYSKLPLTQRLRIFARICEALHSAHRRGVVHRDLKPGNIITSEEGANIGVKILDWGLGKRLDDANPDPKHPTPRPPAFNLTMPGVAFGTPGYIAPEIFDPAASPDLRSDVFQMGVILYELTTQRMPFASYDARGFTILDGNVTHPLYIKDPPSFRDVVEGEFPPLFYEIEPIARRAMTVDPNGRHPSVADLAQDVWNVLERIEREKELMARAQGEVKNLKRIRDEIKTLEEQIPNIWSRFNLGARIDEVQWDRMHDPIHDLIQLKGAWHRKVEDIITPLLIGNSKYGRLPRARELIADLSLLRLMHEGDRIAEADRQFLIQRIRENDPEGKYSAVLDGVLPVGVALSDSVTGADVSEGLSVRILPYEREAKRNNYREGAPLVEGALTEVRSQIQLPAGYYVFEFSHPQYAPMRVPVHIKLKHLRESIINRVPFSLDFELVPRGMVPDGMVVIHRGEATLGHDYYHDGSPTTHNSPPMRKIPFETFLASRAPVTVAEYKFFIESLLQDLNGMIRDGRNEEARQFIETVREALPQARLGIKTDTAPTDEGLPQAFEGRNYYWKIVADGKGVDLRFRLVDPSSHRDPHGDPILLNQPMTVLNFNSAEAYAQWRSLKDGVRYEVISARDKEIISRNSFPWTYPWGYEFNPAFLATRLSFIDIKRDSYAQPVGTHALGGHIYRDKSLYGNVDLLGNVREFAAPGVEESEPDTVYLSGGSVRTAFGVLYLPSGRPYVNRKNWTEQCGGAFRLGLKLPSARP